MFEDRIEILEHTADLAVRINADDEQELFALGAAAVYQLIGQLVPTEAPSTPYRIALQANTREELFHDWLAEVLYWFQVHNILFDRYHFEAMHPTSIKVTAEGRKVDVERSNIHIEIKAVTYHNLTVQPRANGWTATVIFDI